LTEHFLEQKNWELISSGNVSFKRLLIQGVHQPLHSQQYNLLVEDLIKNKLGGKNFDLHKIYAVYNCNLQDAFKSKLSLLHSNWLENSADLGYSEKQTRVLEYFKQFALQFENKLSAGSPPIIYAVHGTTENIAWEICKTGFATFSVIDDGYYGKGMYFTTRSEYAAMYCRSSAKVLIVSAVILGHPYPVTKDPQSKDSFKGKPLKPGYDSHLILEAQVCPLFVVFATKKNQDTIPPRVQSTDANGLVEDYTIDRTN